jgi:MGT family glycosyltransferase
MPDRPIVVFFPEGAYGPTNNCVGIGAVLRDRGSRVVFVIEESFAGKMAEHGFEERLMRLQDPPEHEEAPGQFWIDFIRDTAPVFRESTEAQLSSFIQPTWQALLDGARYVEPRLREIFDEVRPDVIVEDNVCCFPAVVTHGSPWVRIVSCNPAEVPDPDVPPVFSGYPVADRTRWDEFRAEYARTHRDMHAEFADWVREQGAPSLGPLEFIHESPHLNLWLYPEEADYARSRALNSTWRRLDSCVRATDAPWSLPPELAERGGDLIYLSLGSLGSADVELMQRLIDLLGRTQHRAIVSMGPRHEELRLHENMTGAEFLPQPSILPLVDLVITHGGNNTTTEALHFGKPMILLPLFWDQYDNAQRVDELGYGVRLSTYTFTDEELKGAVERLLGDTELRARLAAAGEEIRRRDGLRKAADLIEQLGE